MSMSFHVAALAGDRVAAAFPLIQAAWPGADLGSWRRFVEFFDERVAGKGAGMLALNDPAGCICGILAYRPDRDLQGGLILAIQLFIAIDLSNSLNTVRALLEAAETKALELGCTGLQIQLPNHQSGLASRLRKLGLTSRAGLFWKDVGAPESRK